MANSLPEQPKASVAVVSGCGFTLSVICVRTPSVPSAGLQLHEIVAGHVLHHAAAALHFDAVVREEANADDGIAQRSVAVAVRAARVRGHRAAERRAPRQRHVHRQPLIFPREDPVQFFNCDSGPDRDRHVAGRIIHDRVQAGRVESDPRLRRRQAEVEHRPPADRVDRAAAGAGIRDEPARFGHGRRAVRGDRAEAGEGNVVHGRPSGAVEIVRAPSFYEPFANSPVLAQFLD